MGRQIMTTTFLRHFLRSGFYLAAILLLPGALIGAPILWWLGHRRKNAAPTDVESVLLTQRCQQRWRKLTSLTASGFIERN